MDELRGVIPSTILGYCRQGTSNKLCSGFWLSLTKMSVMEESLYYYYFCSFLNFSNFSSFVSYVAGIFPVSIGGYLYI